MSLTREQLMEWYKSANALPIIDEPNCNCRAGFHENYTEICKCWNGTNGYQYGFEVFMKMVLDHKGDDKAAYKFYESKYSPRRGLSGFQAGTAINIAMQILRCK